MKKAYILPGFTETLNDRPYQNLLNVIERCGYEPVFVELDWKYKDLSDWVRQAEDRLSGLEMSSSIIIGFSFGAMIALSLAAKNIKPALLMLCSLSPYFSEDLADIPVTWKKFVGKRRFAAFSRYSLVDLSQDVHAKTLLFVGEKEDKEVHATTQRAFKSLAGSRLITVAGTGHDITHPNYIKAIAEALKP